MVFTILETCFWARRRLRLERTGLSQRLAEGTVLYTRWRPVRRKVLRRVVRLSGSEKCQPSVKGSGQIFGKASCGG